MLCRGSIRHVMENGTRLPLCDREILSKCIAIWFGLLELNEARKGCLEGAKRTSRKMQAPSSSWLGRRFVKRFLTEAG